MKKIVLFIAFCIFAAGCSSSLRGLMAFSKEQDAIEHQVKKQNKLFARLVADVESGRLKVGSVDKKDIRWRYGEPILEKNMDGKLAWLYRNPLEFNPAKKIYLIFDETSTLSDIEVVTL